jgi:hypothetical protein
MKWVDHRFSLAGMQVLRPPKSANMDGSMPDGRELGGNGWELCNDFETARNTEVAVHSNHLLNKQVTSLQ